MNFSNLKPSLHNYYPDSFDGNPENLAIRILEMYRDRCSVKFEKLEGLSTEEMIFCQMVNKLQKERADELDRAISILKLHGKN